MESLPDFGQFMAKEGPIGDDSVDQEVGERKQQQQDMAIAVTEMLCGADEDEFQLPKKEERRLLFQGGLVGAVHVASESWMNAQEAKRKSESATAAQRRPSALLRNTKTFFKKAFTSEDGRKEGRLPWYKSVKSYIAATSTSKDPGLVEEETMIQGFLFDDVLVFAKPSQSTGQLIIVGLLPVRNVSVRDVGSGTFVFEDDDGQFLDMNEQDEGDDDDDEESDESEDEAVDDKAKQPTGNKKAPIQEDSDFAGMEFAQNKLEITNSQTKERFVVDCGESSHKALWLSHLIDAVSGSLSAQEKEKDPGWKHRIHRGTLWSAALEGNPYEVGRILRNVPSDADQFDSLVMRADERDAIPFHYAALAGHSLVMKQLFAQDSGQVHALDNHLRTPLHYAAFKPSPAAAIVILEDKVAMADCDARDLRSRSPLWTCCDKTCDRLAGFKSLSFKDLEEMRKKAERTASEFIQVLHSHGADLNTKDVSGLTCVSLCANRGALSVLAKLVTIGASLETPSSEGQTGTVLTAACNSRPPDALLVSKLVAWGANVNAHDQEKNTGLHLVAAISDQMGEDERDVIEMLISAGARTDLPNKAGQTSATLLAKHTGIAVEKLQQEWAALEEPTQVQTLVQYHPYRIPYAASPASKTWEDESKVSACRSCEQAFGIMVRKHKCKACGRTFCHACTTKQFTLKVMGDSSPPTKAKVCGGCFNRLSNDMIIAARDLACITPSVPPPAAANDSNRQELFGDRKPNEKEQPGMLAGLQNSVQSTLQQAHEALQERGEKLSQLRDKSEAMSNNAANFSNAAKLLREREERKANWFNF